MTSLREINRLMAIVFMALMLCGCHFNGINRANDDAINSLGELGTTAGINPGTLDVDMIGDSEESTDWTRDKSNRIRFKIDWGVIKDPQVRDNQTTLCHILMNESGVSRAYASCGRKQLVVRIVLVDVGDLHDAAKDSIAIVSSVLLKSDLSTAVIEFHAVAEDDEYGPMILSTKIAFDKNPK